MRTPRRLTPAEIRRRLATLNGAAGDAPWRVVAGRLRKRFVFEGFAPAFGFMAEVALAAQALDHHPDWTNSYATVDIALSTHSAGGLTKLDFDLAARVEAIRAVRVGPARGSPAKVRSPGGKRRRRARR